MSKKLWLLFYTSCFVALFSAYQLGYNKGIRPNIKRGVWVLVQETPYGYRVVGITNANQVFTTNLNIQGWNIK